MQCKDVQALISDYSVGLIEGRRRDAVESHLSECPACSAELEKLQNVMLLVEGMDEKEPPVGLWNGVYNKITEPQRESVWDRIRSGFHGRTAGWSVGFAAAALAGILFFTQFQHPVSESDFTAHEYMQGHAVYASQEFLADQAALNSVAALAYREQVGGGVQ